MSFLQGIIIIVVTFISLDLHAIAADEPPHPSIVLPLNKHTDALKPLYSAQIKTQDANYNEMQLKWLIDVDAPFTYYDCMVQWNIYPGSCPNNTLCMSPYTCEDLECTDIRNSYSVQSPSCPPVINTSTLPYWGDCLCSVNVVNPITSSCRQVMLNYNSFASPVSLAAPLTGCAPGWSFKSFPAHVRGVMALSSSPYALFGNLYDPYKKIAAICLPSNISTPGILVYGNSPYYLLPTFRSFVSYTALIKHPGSFGYFININTIVIKNRSINIPENTTAKISTLHPYTILRTDIYDPLVRRFSMVTKRIPSAKPVPPFGLCFTTSTNASTTQVIGLNVPDIDLNLPEGSKWTISTENSIRQITEDVACLAFVDGGAMSEPAIVIGTFQMEDNFVVFDLENSTFGFSSSLLRKHTSCASLNYNL